MQQERKVIGQNEIIFFDRDVDASELNMLTQNFHGDVVIKGKLMVDVDLHVKCNLHVMGNIECRFEKKINVEGDLFCYKEIGAYNIYVSGLLYCKGSIGSEDIKVGETLCCKERIEAYSAEITVAGDFECCGIKAKEINVLNKMLIEGPIFVRYYIRNGY